ncbi:MAG: Na+:solute symporter [Bacteroidetes bacterium]|nr:Na+:solute symporter [Bacteroidota bacterium]
MSLEFIDWLLIVSFFIISLVIGLIFKNKASGSMNDFFLGGRNLPWYVAGISMVATTFAADTPLAVTELVGLHGISGNWLWWNMLFGGMLTTFFFARLWRRAEILTEVEFIELRYSGPEAAFLRGFKSLYLGLFMNCLIIGWVNVALLSILMVFFEIPQSEALWYVAGAMSVAAIYSSLSGLWGVAVTDMIQFVIAMAGSIILAVIVVNSEKVGGIVGLKAQLPAWSLDFFPAISADTSFAEATGTLTITIGAFLAYLSIWWASWYPGAEPGGGGYIAQRMMSAKDEKNSIYATLFFQIAHYSLRPWPWIIVGLCAIILYPELGVADKKLGYVMAMKEFLPPGLKGLLLVAFFAAYMSTISTQLNWGASYVVNDYYKRFVKPESSFESKEKAEKNYVLMSRLTTIAIMLIALYVTTLIETISGVWTFIIEAGAGLGLVLILRWYWWRINAWSEIVATITPFIVFGAIKLQAFLKISQLQEVYGKEIPADVLSAMYAENPLLIFPGSFFLTAGITTLAWIIATFLTKPTQSAKLESFYQKIMPDGLWGKIGETFNETKKESNLGKLAICWLSAVLMVYSILFMSGKIIFLEWDEAGIWFAMAFVSFLVLRFFVKRTRIFE